MSDSEQTEERGFVCPACAAEGDPAPQPADNYYWTTVKPYRKTDDEGKTVAKHTYKGNRRRSSIYCKKHESIMVLARRKKKLDEGSPTYDPQLAQRVQAWRDWQATHHKDT